MGIARRLSVPVVAAGLLFAWVDLAGASAATERLQRFFAATNGVLADPSTADDPLTKLAAVQRLVGDVVDWRAAAARALGPEWTARTPAEQEEFAALFGDFLQRAFVAIMASRASTTGGVGVAWVAERPEADEVLVTTHVRGRKGSDFPVEYRMAMVDGDWRVRDVILEGVSLVANYRAQLLAILRRTSYADLMTEMRSRVGEARAPDVGVAGGARDASPPDTGSGPTEPLAAAAPSRADVEAPAPSPPPAVAPPLAIDQGTAESPRSPARPPEPGTALTAERSASPAAERPASRPPETGAAPPSGSPAPSAGPGVLTAAGAGPSPPPPVPARSRQDVAAIAAAPGAAADAAAARPQPSARPEPPVRPESAAGPEPAVRTEPAARPETAARPEPAARPESPARREPAAGPEAAARPEPAVRPGSDEPRGLPRPAPLVSGGPPAGVIAGPAPSSAPPAGSRSAREAAAYSDRGSRPAPSHENRAAPSRALAGARPAPEAVGAVVARAPSPQIAAVDRNREPAAVAGRVRPPRFWVQVGAFQNPDTAAQVAARLGSWSPTIVRGPLAPPGPRADSLARVLVGPFGRRADAVAALEGLRASGVAGFVAEDRR